MKILRDRIEAARDGDFLHSPARRVPAIARGACASQDVALIRVRGLVKSALLILALAMLAPATASAQTQMLTVFPHPTDPGMRLVVTARLARTATRTSVTAWIVPSNGSGESPNISIGLVGPVARTPRRRFTLVSSAAACRVRSTGDVLLFAGITANGETLRASVVPIGSCGAVDGALTGSHPSARTHRLRDDPSARMRFGTSPTPEQATQPLATAPGLPFVVMGGTGGTILAFCGPTFLAQRAAYASWLLTIDDAVFLVAQPVAFAHGALWRSELVPLRCA
jgi:hypothetical protein